MRLIWYTACVGMPVVSTYADSAYTAHLYDFLKKTEYFFHRYFNDSYSSTLTIITGKKG